MRILIVEDEPSLSEQLRASLTQSGYVVDLAPDGLEGQYLATEYPTTWLLWISVYPS